MKRFWHIGCLLLCVFAVLCGCKPKVEHATALDFRMNTWVSQEWYGALAQQTCDEIDSQLAALEKKVSIYVDDSDVSRINAAAGKEYVKVSDEVFYLIKNSLKVCEEYGGLFDISIAPLSVLWNVTSDEPTVPSEQDILDAKANVDYQKVLLDEATHSVMLSEEGMRLDLGGAAKGWAVGKMEEIVRKNNVSGYLSVGGNMLVVGKKPGGSDFLIGVRDPRGDSSDYFASVAMDGYTMATTGDYERYFEKDGVRYHHVIDPFTGFPSDKELISVTVINKDGLLADCMSTAVFLKGREGLSDALARTDCMIIAVTEENEIYASPSAWKIIKPNTKTQYIFKNS